MRMMRMGELAAKLGIPRRTFQDWIDRDPDLGIFIDDRYGGTWWIKLDKLAGRQGIDLTAAYMLGSSRWIKAVTLAELAGISRHTMRNWCRNRPGFAKRIGRIFYVDLEEFGASFDDVENLYLATRANSRRREVNE